MTQRRVVITGTGVVSPIGNDTESFRDNLFAGKSGAGKITLFDAEKFKTQFACEVKDFNLNDYIDRKEARRMDPFVHFAIAASQQAIDSSKLDLEGIDLDRAGVIWGSGIGGLRTFVDEVSGFASGDGTPRFNPFFIPKMLVDISSGLISMRFGFRGVNYSTVSACATSGHAISEAYNHIMYDNVDVMITGGSEASITEAGIGGFNAMKAMSMRNDDPETASRPFDRDRDGFVMGEGAGAFIVEELEHARKRGATIYGEVVGYGMSADAHHMTAPHPEGLGAMRGMEMALRKAGMTVKDIDYINGHATSTPLGDIAELKAVKKLFGDHAYNVNISATKSMTGHLLGAAGAIEALACLLAVRHDTVPPTINHFNDDPDIDPKLNLTFNEKQERKVDVALSNVFGFGGHNCSLIIKKFAE